MVVSFCPLLSAAMRAPESLFICDQGRQFSYRDINARVEAYLTNFNVAPEPARIQLVEVSNSVNSIVELFSAMRAGYVAVPVDSSLPAERLASLKQKFNQKVVYCDSSAGDTLPRLGIFTSGSSGCPKLALHSWFSLLANAQACNRIIPIAKDDRTLLSLSLNHIGGFAQVLRALIENSVLVIAGRVESMGVLDTNRITHTSMVATQLQRLVKLKPRLPCLKSVLVGGGPVPPSLVEQARALGIPAMPTYGMSETASQLLTEVAPSDQKIVGKTELKSDSAGQLWVKSDSLFLGYYDCDKVQGAINDDGWFATGDIAELVDGKWCITGRVDNQFVSGGKNIQPEEIERFLLALPMVRRAVVVPVPHCQFGHTPFAFCELVDSLVIDSEFIQSTISNLKQQLPGYMVPRFYGVLPSNEIMQDLKGLKSVKGLSALRKPLQTLAIKEITE